MDLKIVVLWHTEWRGVFDTHEPHSNIYVEKEYFSLTKHRNWQVGLYKKIWRINRYVIQKSMEMFFFSHFIWGVKTHCNFILFLVKGIYIHTSMWWYLFNIEQNTHVPIDWITYVECSRIIMIHTILKTFRAAEWMPSMNISESLSKQHKIQDPNQGIKQKSYKIM